MAKEEVSEHDKERADRARQRLEAGIARVREEQERLKQQEEKKKGS